MRILESLQCHLWIIEIQLKSINFAFLKSYFWEDSPNLSEL